MDDPQQIITDNESVSMDCSINEDYVDVEEENDVKGNVLQSYALNNNSRDQCISRESSNTKNDSNELSEKGINHQNGKNANDIIDYEKDDIYDNVPEVNTNFL